jgi:response regulator RpfG family c-di-GMP phosphodiesterase
MAKPVLLVVDHDEDALRSISRALNKHYRERYRILSGTSGREALKKLQQLRKQNQSVALILVNQRLADVPGVEFLEQASALCLRHITTERQQSATFRSFALMTTWSSRVILQNKTSTRWSTIY